MRKKDWVLVLWCSVFVAACNSGDDETATTTRSAAASPPPAAPTNVAATADVGSITITWTESAGATSHTLHWTRNPEHGYTRVANARPPYVLSTLLRVEHSFHVTALGDGGESAPSATVSATPEAD